MVKKIRDPGYLEINILFESEKSTSSNYGIKSIMYAKKGEAS